MAESRGRKGLICGWICSLGWFPVPEVLGNVGHSGAREGGVGAVVLDPVDGAVLLQGGHGFAGADMRGVHAAVGRIDANGNALCRKGDFE